MEPSLLDRMIISHKCGVPSFFLPDFSIETKHLPAGLVGFQKETDKYWCHFFSVCVANALKMCLLDWQG